jgi:hypothetical protein
MSCTISIKRGKASWFGGPNDEGVAPDEGLAFIHEVEQAPYLFLPEQPPDTTGLARRLDPKKYYIAMRFDYEETPKEALINMEALVRNPLTGKSFWARPADWGPHEDTGRIADLSPGLMDALCLDTDDEVEVLLPVAVGAEARAIIEPVVREVLDRALDLIVTRCMKVVEDMPDQEARHKSLIIAALSKVKGT